MLRVASLGSGSAQCCSMIQLCRIDLHLTLAILPNQMDVWQPEHTLDIQACVHASDNTHTHTPQLTELHRRAHTHSLGKVTMLLETKGQMVDNDTVPALARWLKYAFLFVCAHEYVPIHLSEVVFTSISLNFSQQCVLWFRSGYLFWPVSVSLRSHSKATCSARSCCKILGNVIMSHKLNHCCC